MNSIFKKYFPGASGVYVTPFPLYHAPQMLCIVFDSLMESGPGTGLPGLIQVSISPTSTRIITKKTMTLSCMWQGNTHTFSVHGRGLTTSSSGMEPLNTPLPLEGLFYTGGFLAFFGKISGVYRNLANE